MNFGGSLLTVTNSTVSDNSAPYGGGIANVSGTVILNNTIIAGNTSNDIYGPVQATSSYDLIGNSTGITNLSSLNSTNLSGTTSNPINPDLRPFAE